MSLFSYIYPRACVQTESTWRGSLHHVKLPKITRFCTIYSMVYYVIGLSRGGRSARPSHPRSPPPAAGATRAWLGLRDAASGYPCGTGAARDVHIMQICPTPALGRGNYRPGDTPLERAHQPRIAARRCNVTGWRGGPTTRRSFVAEARCVKLGARSRRWRAAPAATSPPMRITMLRVHGW